MGRNAAFFVVAVCMSGPGGLGTAEAFTGRQAGHLLFEASLGGALGAGEDRSDSGEAEGTAGYSVGLLGGIGGKLKGFPPRFFLVGGIESASWGALSSDSFGEGRVDRQATMVTGGLRMLFPLWSRRLRLVTEARSGVAMVDSEGGRPGLPGATTADTYGVMLLGAGLQARLNDRLSAGFRLDRTWGLDTGADIAAAAAGLGRDGSGRGRLALGLTFTLHL